MTLNRSLKRTLLSLLGLMALFAPTAALAQFGYELTNGTITITSYPDWTGGAVTIPSTIEGVPVTTIGQGSFSENTWLTSVMIPNSVTTIGDSAFEGCSSLTNITIAGGVIVIEDGAFGGCSDLTSIAIPNSVTSIGYSAFSDCWSLTNVTVGSGLTTLGGWAFYGCTELAGVFFTGNAPGAPAGGTTMDMFTYDNNATVYYLPGTTGWGSTFNGVPTALWNLPPANITWPSPPPITYGTALGANQLDATASTTGTFAYSPPAGTVLGAGTNVLSVVFSPSETASYSGVTDNVSIAVLREPLTVTADDATRPYGTTNPVFTGSIVGLQNGDDITATYSCGATAGSPPGTYPIVPALVDNGNRLGNYSVTTNNGSLTIIVLYTVATDSLPAAGGSVWGGGTFTNGSSVMVAASPSAGYAFVNWTEDGVQVSTSASYTFTATTNLALTANFAPVYIVTTSASPLAGGATAGGGSYVSGSSVNVLAAPNAGYAFVNWTDNGTQVSRSASYTFAVASDRTLTANFTPLYAVVASASLSEAGSASGGGMYTNGASVIVTANTNAGYQFVAWTESGQVVSASASYSFTLSGDRTLVASFVPYPFVAPKGNYSGLFSDQTNGVSPQSCGSFTFTTTAKSGYSGSLQLAGRKHTFSGQFDGSGRANKTITRGAQNPLTVDLRLDLLSGAEWVSGTVGDGAWTAELYGGRAPFNANTNVAPQAGSYTIVIPGAYGLTNEPAGDSYGTLTVSKAGLISLHGALADGTSMTPSASLLNDGEWPLYASFHSGQGVLWGWLTFTNASGLGGTVAWVKPVLGSGIYPRGFSVTAAAVGARYFPPGRGTNVLGLTVSTHLALTLQGGGLAVGTTNQITLASNNRVTPVSGPKLTLAFTPTTGAFSGSVVNPASPKPISFGGVVLQSQGMGSGFFLGASGSGEVLLEP